MEELISCERRRIEAMLCNDADALGALLHDDLGYGHGSGLVDSRATYLEAIRSGRTRYVAGGSRISDVRRLGDVGLMRAAVSMQAELQGVDTAIRNIVLMVWTRVNGDWLLIAHQPTRVPA